MSIPGADTSKRDVLTKPGPASDDGSRALAPAFPWAAMSMGGGMGGSGVDVLHGGFNQTWLYHCLRRRWLLALLMGLLVGSAIAGALLWLFPPTSRITSLLEVRPETSNPLTSDSARQISPIQAKAEAMNHMALIRSPFVLEAALQKTGIGQLDAVQSHPTDAVLWLSDELKATFPGDSQILEVKYEGEEDPDEMVKIVKAVVDAYREKVLFQDNIVSSATKDDLVQVLATMKEELKKLLDEHKRKSELTGRSSMEIEVPQLRNEIQLLQTQIERAQQELVDAEVMKQLAIASARSPAALEQAVAMEVDKDPMIANYKQAIFTLQQELQARASVGRQQNSAILKRLQAQIGQQQQMMEQAKMVAEKQIKAQLAKIPNEGLRQAIIEHQIRTQSAQGRLQEYQSKLEEANKRMDDLGVDDPELAMLENDIETSRASILELESKIQSITIAKNAQAVRGSNAASEFEKVRVIQEAAALKDVNWLERLLIAGVGGLAGLALTAYGVALLEFRHRRLNEPGDMDEGLGVRVLGVLPSASLKALQGRGLVATQVAEAIDNVRTVLLHAGGSERHQVVMVASPVSMEGTSTVASSLARSLARAGKRTLLVDADLRSPSLNKLFGMSLDDGLADVLRGQAELADAIRPTQQQHLYLLTAGVLDPAAIGALATQAPAAIIEKLRDQFDYVILDAPPVLGIADGMTLAHSIDGVILTVLRDHSEIRSVHQAIEKLRNMGLKVLGAVVNGVPTKADRRVVKLHQAAARGGTIPALEVTQ